MLHRLLFLFSCVLLFGVAAVEAQDDDIIATIYQTVNVRSGPGARFDIVAQVSEGATVTVDGRESDESIWLRVRLSDGKAGWVPAYVLILQADPAALPIIGRDDEATDTNVTVTTFGRVNVRSGPGITYPIVAQLDIDDAADVKARSNAGNDWLYIENEDLTGWIAYFTVLVQGNPAALPIRVPDAGGHTLVTPSVLVRTRFNTRLRDDATLDAPIVGIVPFDNEVTPLAKSDDGLWLYVAYDDLTGWAVRDLFAISDEQLADVPVYAPGVEYVVGADGVIPVAATPEATDPAAQPTPEATAPTAQPTPETTPQLP